MKKNKKLIYLIIAISFIAITAIGATYAYFLASGYSNKTSTVSVTADALDEVSCTATDLSMTVTGSNMKQGSSSASGTVAKSNSSTLTCTSTKHTTGATKCTMDIKYTPTNVFTKSSNNTSDKKELTLSGTGTATSGGINIPTYSETDMATLTSATTIIDDLEWIFDSNDTLTYTMTSKFYNYNFNQNDLAGKTYNGTISVENITCTGVSPTYSTVTFNTNGGSVSQNTKQVIEGYTYGNLPTPTKSGATFKGWHGKNLINLDVPLSNPSDTSGDNTTPRTFTLNTYVKGLAFNNYFYPTTIITLNVTSTTIELVARSGYGIGIPILSSSNKTYSLSFDTNGTDNRGFSTLYYDVSGNLITYSQFGIGNNHVAKSFTTPNNTYYLVVELYGADSNTNILITNLQLEEGSAATAYEPYFVTKDTVVAQSGNHSLTAVWE